MKKDIRDDAAMDIAWFLYENALPFDVVRSPSYLRMCESISKHGPGFQPATYHEVRDSLLKKAVTFTNEFVNEHKAEWKKVGCTIRRRLDWLTLHKMTYLEFLLRKWTCIKWPRLIGGMHIVMLILNYKNLPFVYWV